MRPQLDISARCLCGQRQRMQLPMRPVHFAFQSGVNSAMLLHPIFSCEAGIGHLSGVVIAVASQICDRDLRLGKSLSDQSFNILCGHGHGMFPHVVTLEGRAERCLFQVTASAKLLRKILLSSDSSATCAPKLTCVPPKRPTQVAGIPRLPAAARSASA